MREHVVIICTKHREYNQLPVNHILLKHGCPICRTENNTLTREEFIEKARKVHGNKYDYSETVYVKRHLNIIIKCKEHGYFTQQAGNHLNGSGCPKCSNKYQYNNEEFIEKARKVHGNKYDYSKTLYTNSNSKITITCPTHGDFLQKAADHINNGTGCPKCNQSKGERLIENWLKNKNIKYKTQKTFEKCRNVETNYKLPFDFYLPEYNVCIEYDGPQHFGIWNSNKFNIDFNKLQKRDNIKTNFCKENDIVLIRVPYNKPTIERFLDNIFVD